MSIVSDALTANVFPVDRYAVYFVLSASDITVTGFCNNYCGWHVRHLTYFYHFTLLITFLFQSGFNFRKNNVNTPVLVGFSGHPGSCPNPLVCMANAGPNTGYGFGGDAGGYGMVNIVAHELAEAATDPYGNAWLNADGYENADL